MPVRFSNAPTSLNGSLTSCQPTDAKTAQFAMTLSKDDNSAAEKDQSASDEPKQKPGITFAAQDQLARLPIPELRDTCRKYLEVLKPLQSNRQQNDTAAAVEEFLKSEGPELQARLKKYATGKTSYIEQFCTFFMKSKSTNQIQQHIIS